MRAEGAIVAVDTVVVGAVGDLEALAPAQVGAVVEHVLGLGVQRPVVALARSAGLARLLQETVVQRQVVPNRVLPLLVLGSVERKLVAYELVDVAERQALPVRVEDCHGDERDVAVGRLASLDRPLALAA